MRGIFLFSALLSWVAHSIEVKSEGPNPADFRRQACESRLRTSTSEDRYLKVFNAWRATEGAAHLTDRLALLPLITSRGEALWLTPIEGTKPETGTQFLVPNRDESIQHFAPPTDEGVDLCLEKASGASLAHWDFRHARVTERDLKSFSPLLAEAAGLSGSTTFERIRCLGLSHDHRGQTLVGLEARWRGGREGQWLLRLEQGAIKVDTWDGVTTRGQPFWPEGSEALIQVRGREEPLYVEALGRDANWLYAIIEEPKKRLLRISAKTFALQSFLDWDRMPEPQAQIRNAHFYGGSLYLWTDEGDEATARITRLRRRDFLRGAPFLPVKPD